MTQEYSVPPSRFGAVFKDVLPHDFDPNVNDIEALARREALISAETRLAARKLQLNELEIRHPNDAEALKTWLKGQRKALLSSDVKIDNEMLAEARLLDELIKELRADDEPDDLIQLAETLEDIVLTENELAELSVGHSVAA